MECLHSCGRILLCISLFSFSFLFLGLEEYDCVSVSFTASTVLVCFLVVINGSASGKLRSDWNVDQQKRWLKCAWYASFVAGAVVLGGCLVYELKFANKIVLKVPVKLASVDDELLEDISDDDSTTRTLERLSSAATCLVAGVEYTHGQQIYRQDPCEFCLCLDGEMFCWWQDCPPTMEGPCKESKPFSPCANGQPQSSEAPPKTTSPPEIKETSETTDESSSTITEQLSTERSSSVSDAPTECTVMGKSYPIGASLPHDTGNCVECTCGAEAQITCSPHQCSPPGDDINDYRPPGPRSADAF